MSEIESKQLWVVSGGNGAGKSTYYEQVLAPHGAMLVNADVIAKSMSPERPENESYAAAQKAMFLLQRYIDEGCSFVYETVFSHVSKIDLIKLAKQRGYQVNLIYIHLSSGLHVARVHQRVSQGGHNVPTDKVVTRVPRTIKNITIAANFADTVLLYDNSSMETPFQLIAQKTADKVQAMVSPLPTWAANMLF